MDYYLYKVTIRTLGGHFVLVFHLYLDWHLEVEYFCILDQDWPGRVDFHEGRLYVHILQSVVIE